MHKLLGGIKYSRPIDNRLHHGNTSWDTSIWWLLLDPGAKVFLIVETYIMEMNRNYLKLMWALSTISRNLMIKMVSFC